MYAFVIYSIDIISECPSNTNNYRYKTSHKMHAKKQPGVLSCTLPTNIRMNLTFMAQTVLFPATSFTGQFGDEIAPGVWLWLVQISLLLPSFFFHGAIMAHSNNSLKRKKSLACFSVQYVLMSCPQLILLSA